MSGVRSGSDFRVSKVISLAGYQNMLWDVLKTEHGPNKPLTYGCLFRTYCWPVVSKAEKTSIHILRKDFPCFQWRDPVLVLLPRKEFFRTLYRLNPLLLL